MAQDNPHYLGVKEGETTASALTALTKGTISLIPGLGPVLSEVIGSFIPNLRTERVISYLQFLQNYLSEESLELVKKLPEKVAFLEAGMLAAGLNPYPDRLERISSAVVNGLCKDEFNADHQSMILRTVAELNRAEAIILGFYGQNDGSGITMGMADAYQKKFPDIWPPYPPYKFKKDERPSDSELAKYTEQMGEYKYIEAVRESYIQHLLSLTLLRRDQKTPVMRRSARSDDFSAEIGSLQEAVNGLIKDPSYRITLFGLQVLNAIQKPGAVV